MDAGSGDVFVDLGFEDAGERKLRVQLAMPRLDRDVEIVIRPTAEGHASGLVPARDPGASRS